MVSDVASQPVDPNSSATVGGSAMWSPRCRRWAMMILLLGALLRVAFFVVDRPLWIDEAMLAANLIERDYEGLLEPMIYGQVAPVGYLMAERFFGDVFGETERAFRIMSLLPSLLTLPFMWWTVRRLLPAREGLVALLLFALSEPLIYYAGELKPYALDVAAVMGLFWLALRIWQDGYRLRDVIGFGVAGVIGLLFSYPAVFGIAVFGGVLILSAGLDRRMKDAASVAVVCLVCAAFFLLLHQMFMKDSASVRHHTGYWEAKEAFMPLPPKNLHQLEWFIHRPLDFFVDPMRFKAFGLAMVPALIGGALLWKQDKRILAMCVGMPVLILLVSVTKLYPFGTQADLSHPILGRVLLFCVPLILLMLAKGLGWVCQQCGSYGRRVMLIWLLVLMVHPTLRVAHMIKDPAQTHDARPALQFLEKHAQAGDLVFTNWPGLMVTNFYWEKYDIACAPPEVIREGGNYVAQITDYQKYVDFFEGWKGKRVWIFFLHTDDIPEYKYDEKYVAWFLDRHATPLPVDGREMSSFSEQYGTLRLYEFPAAGFPPADR